MRTKFYSKKLKGRDHSEDLSVDGRIILECMSEKYDWNCGLDSSNSGQDQ
jgi:hypothetical protein